MKSLIIGSGEVGSALKEIVSQYHETFIRDLEDFRLDGVEVLHICYPDHNGFDKTTRDYITQYNPKITVIHSSVRVGTTVKCGDGAVYSPVRGRHPQLAQEMKQFPKFIAGLDTMDVLLAAKYFEVCGWDTFTGDNPDSFEFLKMMSNVHMGLEVAWRQEVGRMMKGFGINADDYEKWEETYSNGYVKLGQNRLIRSRMRPDPIGGHCILPCTALLNSQYHSPALDFILSSNEKAKAGK